MELKGKTALVTGAAGFIGSHLVQELLREGVEVRAFIRKTSQSPIGMLRYLTPEEFDAIELLRGDLRDSDSVRQAVRGCDVVFNLAALVWIPYSYTNPREVFETNAYGPLNVFAAAREYGAERVVHFSTSETYGTAQYVPIDEKHPVCGQSPYAASKVAADELARSFFLSFELPVITARPFNAYGPRQSRAIVPTILDQAVRSNELMLGNLDPRRDLTFAVDTCRAVMALAECDAALGEAVNIGQGSSVSIGELVEMIGHVLAKELIVRQDPQRMRPSGSEVMELVCDSTKLRELTGWTPEFSLEAGLERTAKWVEEHLNDHQLDGYERRKS